MRMLPRTKHEWFGFILFPFKAYVVIAFVIARLCSRALWADAVIVSLLLGYVLSFIVLFLAALVLFICGRRDAALADIAFAGLALVFGWSLLPYLARV
jgi:hypothetical protein